MAKKQISRAGLKKDYFALTEKEKDLRVEIVQLREKLLFSEGQFFYSLYHFFGYLVQDIKGFFIKKRAATPTARDSADLKHKISELNERINKLSSYKRRLVFITKSPFMFAVYVVNDIREAVYFIPTLIERRRVQKKLENAAEAQKKSDIINFGAIPYHLRKLRQQHLAEELAKKGERVFYIENRFFVQEKHRPLFEIALEKENVFIVKLSCTRDLAIYHQKPTDQELKSIVKSFHAFLKQAGVGKSTAKIDYPFWAYLLPHLKMPVIYDCMDDYEGFDITGEHIIGIEKELIKKADLTVVCSRILKEKISKYKPRKSLLIKNACEYDHFAPASDKKDTCSAGLCWVKQPVIGFFGAIGEWIDAALLEKAAMAYPEASFVLIGSVQNDKVLSVGERIPNVYLLGEKPYAKLPEYLRTFDICMIPFRIDEHTTLIDPVKLYEYFAAGKPVVTTGISEIVEYRKLMYYSKTDGEFVANIKTALKEKGKSLILKRQELARKNTWEARATVLYREILRLS